MENAPTKAKPRLDRSVTGRKKGTVNRVTRLLKDCILLAGEQAGGGGKDGMTNYLRQQAVENPGPFLALLAKILPTQINADPDDQLVVVIRQFHDEDGQITARDPRAPKLIEHES
jgi:hypothetical protein